MSVQPHVVIVLGKCRRSGRGFGMRLEESGPGLWTADWAFPVEDRRAAREGYGSAEIYGAFAFGDGYPGCPHCRQRAVVRCGCGKAACWDGESRRITCPWCGQTGTVEGVADRLTAGEDR